MFQSRQGPLGSFWRSLGAFRGHAAILEVHWAFSLEVACLDLLSKRSLVQACSQGGHWLILVPWRWLPQVCLCLFQRRSLVWTWSHGRCLLGPAPTVVTGSGQQPGCCWLSPVPSDVRSGPLELTGSPLFSQRSPEPTGSAVFPQILLLHTCSSGGRWLSHSLVGVTGLGLFLQRSLVGACSEEGHCLRSGPTEVVGSGLFPWRLLPGTCSEGGLCLRPGPAEVAGLGLRVWF